MFKFPKGGPKILLEITLRRDPGENYLWIDYFLWAKVKVEVGIQKQPSTEQITARNFFILQTHFRPNLADLFSGKALCCTLKPIQAV